MATAEITTSRTNGSALANPDRYTPESVRQWSMTGNDDDLVPRDERSICLDDLRNMLDGFIATLAQATDALKLSIDHLENEHGDEPGVDTLSLVHREVESVCRNLVDATDVVDRLKLDEAS